MANINLGKIVPTPKGVWDINNTYEKLDIVTDQNKKRVYIAVKDVPVGISVTNTNYWENLIKVS